METAELRKVEGINPRPKLTSSGESGALTMIKQFLHEDRNILCREKLKWVQPALSKHGMWANRNILILGVFVGTIDEFLRLVKVGRRPSTWWWFLFQLVRTSG
jgi:hypothetical protein